MDTQQGGEHFQASAGCGSRALPELEPIIFQTVEKFIRIFEQHLRNWSRMVLILGVSPYLPKSVAIGGLRWASLRILTGDCDHILVVRETPSTRQNPH